LKIFIFIYLGPLEPLGQPSKFSTSTLLGAPIDVPSPACYAADCLLCYIAAYLPAPACQVAADLPHCHWACHLAAGLPHYRQHDSPSSSSLLLLINIMVIVIH
jgi:hypothetical protein